MARKSSVHGRRRSSAVATPLANVAESENELDEQATLVAKAAQETQAMELLEAEREARFHEAERELRSVLETDDVSDHVRKRQLTRLFDRFRYEYTQLSTQFRESLRFQQKLMDKCMEMKNELVMSAIRIKTAKQLQEEELKNLIYYRDECEHAWKATKVCEERERDAMQIIDQLKTEIDDLQGQVKTLLGMDTTNRRAAMAKSSPSSSTATSSPSPMDPPGLSPIRSPTKKLLATASPVSSPSKGKAGTATELPDTPQLMSFEEWKLSTRVWCPPQGYGSQKTTTPTQEELLFQEQRHEIARCVSVPTLQPSAMERASTAVASSSPSRRHQQKIAELEPRRATTSVSSKRVFLPPQQLPSVINRKAPS